MILPRYRQSRESGGVLTTMIFMPPVSGILAVKMFKHTLAAKVGVGTKMVDNFCRYIFCTLKKSCVYLTDYVATVSVSVLPQTNM